MDSTEISADLSLTQLERDLGPPIYAHTNEGQANLRELFARHLHERDHTMMLESIKHDRQEAVDRIESLKSDLLGLRHSLDTELSQYELELEGLREALEGEVGRLRTEFDGLRSALSEQLERAARVDDIVSNIHAHRPKEADANTGDDTVLNKVVEAGSRRSVTIQESSGRPGHSRMMPAPSMKSKKSAGQALRTFEVADKKRAEMSNRQSMTAEMLSKQQDAGGSTNMRSRMRSRFGSVAIVP
ncbi:unnamed protein product [Pedinophyceae sp. YPF-701]|nr:unnamed protein product [Pedinophyceae sp. YPF-701]